MKRILTYQVYPTIPESLSFLEVLSRNLWWCWKPDAVELFRRIDPLLWKESNGNPIFLLAHVNLWHRNRRRKAQIPRDYDRLDIAS